jgi:ketosteroid isomerase-like protein
MTGLSGTGFSTSVVAPGVECGALDATGEIMNSNLNTIKQAVLDIERSINARWNTGDCTGYLETFSEDVTYCDPATPTLLVGRKAVEDHIRRLYKNPHIVRSEYLNPEVSVSAQGDLAVLGYNLKNYVVDEAGGEKLLMHWNSTEVYRLIDTEWRIVHSHWSFVQHPAIMRNPSV